MRALGYAFQEGWKSVWRGRGSSVLAVVAIALAMIVLGALLLVTWNVERLLAEWTSATELSVYLRDDTTSEQRGAIEALIDQSGVSAGREYVSKADALLRFRREFADLASLTSGFDGNPFQHRSKCRCALTLRATAARRIWYARLRASRVSPTCDTTESGWPGSLLACRRSGGPAWPWAR